MRLLAALALVGKTVRLLGVNRSGLEYACVQGWGFSDGPTDAASIAALKSWGIDAVRVPGQADSRGTGTPTGAGAASRQRGAGGGLHAAAHVRRPRVGGWTWDTWTCSSGPALIGDYGGTPTAFGAGFRTHLLSLQGR